MRAKLAKIFDFSNFLEIFSTTFYNITDKILDYCPILGDFTDFGYSADPLSDSRVTSPDSVTEI